MLRILKIPFYKSFRKFGYPKMMPINMDFMVTYNCNSKCKTCNIWKMEDFSQELKLWEYEEIFNTIGKPFWVTMAGGEPFLRADFIEVIKKLCKICHPAIINIPTNASLYKVVPKAIKEITNVSPKTKIIVNISLDGINGEHDKIRGFPGSFKSVMKTIHDLKKIDNNNFILGINSIISKFNIKNFYELYRFVNENIQPDSYIIEIAQNRRELFNLNFKLLSSNEEVVKVLEFFIEKIEQRRLTGTSKLIKSFRLVYYNYLLNIFKKQMRIIPCYASWASCHIDPYGNIWTCATNNFRLGSLRKNNYDFKKVWFSKEAYKIREKLRQKKCFCQLANVSYTNILCNFESLMKVLGNFI